MNIVFLYSPCDLVEFHCGKLQVYFAFFCYKFSMGVLHLHLNHDLGLLFFPVVEAEHNVPWVFDEQGRYFIFILNYLAFIKVTDFLEIPCFSRNVGADIVVGLLSKRREQTQVLLSSLQQHRSSLQHDDEFQVQVTKVFILRFWDAGVKLLTSIFLLGDIPREHNFEQVLILVLVIVALELILIHKH